MIGGLPMRLPRVVVYPLLCVGALLATGRAGRAQAPADAPHRPDRILVKPRANVSVAELERAHAALGAESLRTYPALENLQIVRIPEGKSVDEVLAEYRDSGLVE